LPFLGSPLKFKGRMNFDFLKIGRKRGFYPNYFGNLGYLRLKHKMEAMAQLKRAPWFYRCGYKADSIHLLMTT
ncbi:hypothetical protein, partial [Seonamhaeicola sp.]|uniref:hypothetical protein n=1 Tax=Seonamhaeicola sp. TaxID=1912245 RepID=UPI0026146461